MLRVLPLGLLILLGACNRQPEWYPPPEQHQPIPLPVEQPGSLMVEMDDPKADDYIVRDIGPAQGRTPWRWAQKRPTVKIFVLSSKGLKFLTDLTIWEDGFKQTGPVTISFFIGDKLLDKVTYDTPGFKHFEKPVNPDWLRTASDNELGAEIDKIYTAPLDGAKFGFIITRMGLAR